MINLHRISEVYFRIRGTLVCIIIAILLNCFACLYVAGNSLIASEDGRPELILQTGHTLSLTRVAVGPDGKWVVTASTDTLIKIWDRESGRELRTLAGHSGSIRALDRSSDGKYIASGANDRTVRVWDVALGKQIWKFETGTSSIESVVFSSDGGKIAAAGTNGFVRIWNVADGQPFRDLSIEGVNFSAAAFGPGGRLIAVAGSDSTIKEWNLEGKAKPKIYRSEREKILALTYSSDGLNIAAGGENKRVSIWRTDRARSAFTFLGHEDRVLAVEFLKSDEIVSVDSDHNVRFWNPSNGIETRGARKLALDEYTKAESAAIDPNGGLTLYGYGNRSALLVEPVRGEKVQTFEAKTVGYETVAISSDGRWLAAGSRDKTIKLWDLRSGECLSPLMGHDGYVRAATFHPDNQRLISGGIDGSILIWSTASGENPTRLGGHGGGVNSLAISSSGRLLVSGGVDGAIRVWDLDTFKELRPLLGHTAGINSVAISRDGKVAVSGGVDKTVRVWDLASGAQIALVSHDAAVKAVSISSDGKRVASGGLDGMVKLSNPLNGAIEHELANLGERILTVAFSPDGAWVTAGTLEKSVKAWRTFDGSQKQIPQGHQGPVTAAFFEPNGKWLATASEDGSVNIWQTGTFARIATLLALTGGEEWLIVTPVGYFDGSPEAWRQLSWRFSDQPFDVSSVEVFFNEFYQPGLLVDLLQGRGLPDKLDIAKKDRRQPLLALSTMAVGPSDRMVRISIKVSEAVSATDTKGSGAKDVRLFRNGALVHSWNRDVLDGAKKDVTLTKDVPIVYGPNEFTAYAFNRDNVKSNDSTVSVTGPETLRRAAVTHVIAIGVGENQNPKFSLNYIESDVNEFVDTFKRKQEELAPTQEIRVTRLLDAGATKEKILAAFRAEIPDAAQANKLDRSLSNVKPEDTVVVYFSGHGFSNGKRFYMVPFDIGTESSGIDLAKIADKSISDLELQDAFQNVDARNVLLIIDACNSGMVLESDEKRRGPMNNKGLAQFAYEKGMFVLTASQPNENAYVSAERKRSYLAYALIEEGLNELKADTGPVDGRIHLREWFDYASRRVPEMRNETIAKLRKEENVKALNQEQVKGLRELEKQPGVQRPRVFYRRQRNREEMVIALARPRTAFR